MPAYVIGSYDVTDPDTYSAYVPAVIPLLQKHGAEVLVADYEAKTLEGEGRGINVVLRFASEEAALAWYNDPDYDGPRNIRISSSTNSTMVLAKGFEPPAT
jgi:uncharacterized protein (DUF1330 family)